jgi:hypothetical protein
VGDVLHVVGLDLNGLPYLASSQTTDGVWHAGSQLPGPGVPMSKLAVSRDGAGRLYVLGVGATDRRTYLVSFQNASNAWQAGGLLD